MPNEQSPQFPERPHGPEGPPPEPLPADHPFFQGHPYPDNTAGLSARLEQTAAYALRKDAEDIGNDKTEVLVAPNGTIAEILPNGVLKETHMDGTQTYDGGTVLDAMRRQAESMPAPSLTERIGPDAINVMHPAQQGLWELLQQLEQPPEQPPHQQ